MIPMMKGQSEDPERGPMLNNEVAGLHIPADNPVRLRVQALRPCERPTEHARLQPPHKFGDLTKAESLNPADILWYMTCGLCAGLLEVLN